MISETAYYPFGRPRYQLGTSANSLKYLHTGHELDSESTIIYSNARYRDPVIGRFISVDPLFVEQPENCGIQECNLYSYTMNNPINFIDPTGKDGIGIQGSGNINLFGIDIGISAEARVNSTSRLDVMLHEFLNFNFKNWSSGFTFTLTLPDKYDKAEGFGAEVDAGIDFLVNNADSIHQALGKSETIFSAAGGVVQGADFELSYMLDENWKYLKNDNGEKVFEATFSIPGLMPGVNLGLEYHQGNISDTQPIFDMIWPKANYEKN